MLEDSLTLLAFVLCQKGCQKKGNKIFGCFGIWFTFGLESIEALT
jgi:hypothetical protein